MLRLALFLQRLTVHNFDRFFVDILTVLVYHIVNAVGNGVSPAGPSSPAGDERARWCRRQPKPTIVTGREKPVAMRTCLNCVYVCCDPCEWLRCHDRGEPLVPRCANHPQWPGQLREVPGTPCRNYQPKPPPPDESDDTVRRIPLSNGQFVLVDAADYEWLSQYNWHLCGGGYAARCEKSKRILMHRQIMQPPDGMLVDHIDGNKANNCRSNLRLCTRPENQRNARKERGCASQYKGVFRDKRCNKWFAKYRDRGKYHGLGYFDLEVDAARAYDYAAVLHYGEFARLNFPEEWPPERRAQLHAQRDAAKTEGKKARTKQGQSKKAKTRSRKSRAETRRRRETLDRDAC